MTDKDKMELLNNNALKHYINLKIEEKFATLRKEVDSLFNYLTEMRDDIKIIKLNLELDKNKFLM